MTISRRDFLKAGATTAAIAAIASTPRPLLAQLGGPLPEMVPPIDDPRLAALAARALEEARAMGADYADVRLTHTWQRDLIPGSVNDFEMLTVGVRALVGGYWGFASGPVWSPNEMARLGRESVHQAKTSASGKPRPVELATVPVVRDGHWVMPVKIDPFEVSPFEINDYLQSMSLVLLSTPGTNIPRNVCQLFKQEKAFASTAGSYCTQRTYRTAGEFAFSYSPREGKIGAGQLLSLSPAGVGWELYRDQPLREEIRRVIEEIREDASLPIVPVDVGRYDTALDAFSVAKLVHETLGSATELDRALGYEANDGGTSYLLDPFAEVGSYEAGAPLLTVSANRGEPGGCATVKWDDEGVVPDEFTLVKDGVLTDFQTTRESASWLKSYYGKTGKPVRSHGCASAPDANYAPLQHVPNLVMSAGRQAHDFDSIITELGKGIAVKGMELDMDFQHSSGLGIGRVYEVKNGKRVALINAAGLLFRATELWKGLLVVGGAPSVRRYGMTSEKGEPAQQQYSSVSAAPAAFKQLTLIDPLRKA